ncbi:MAG: hypothetical protein H0T08_02105 [Acidobacteria bacterium]|jgi:hypothetical protein|nr:hypothetical protein [Acidobacteriota bacterium]
MKANNYISKTEHKLLLTVAFTAFIFVLTIITLQVVVSYNYSVSNNRFSGTNDTIKIPLFHFLTLFIFIALLKTKRFLLPLFLTVFYAFVFIYGLSVRYNAGRVGGEEFSPKVAFLDQVYRGADNFDYIAAVFISILLFWQISILLRMLIKTLQRKTELP